MHNNHELRKHIKTIKAHLNHPLIRINTVFHQTKHNLSTLDYFGYFLSIKKARLNEIF